VESPAWEKILHETIRKVGDDIDALRFNTAIFSNDDLREMRSKKKPPCALFVKAFCPIARTIPPPTWRKNCGAAWRSTVGPVCPWPTYDPARLIATEVKLVGASKRSLPN